MKKLPQRMLVVVIENAMRILKGDVASDNDDNESAEMSAVDDRKDDTPSKN